MKKIKILAVDDNVVNLQSLVQELQGTYEVVPVSSGSRALRYLKKETADLILLDIQMPDMDGLETLEQIRNSTRSMMIPVIFLTSTNDKVTVVEGMKLGISDFVVKPFQREDLLARIDRTLKKNGIIAIERWELIQRLKELAELIQGQQWKQAAMKAKEISGYKTTEEVIRRVKNTKLKIDTGEYAAAEQNINRLIQMLTSQNTSGNPSRQLSQLDWSMKLNEILDALDNFRNEDAKAKVNELLEYDMPEEHRKTCQDIIRCLKNYDDADAERLLLQMLDDATSAF